MKRPKRGAAQRVPGQRNPRRVLRVLTEGAVTEPAYLAQWARRSRNTHIDFAEYGMAPLSLVQRAREHQRESQRRGSRHRGDFDEIWRIFDVDEHPNLYQAIAEARHSEIRVAISNPCFELWLILHLQDQTAAIDRHKAQRLASDLNITDGKRLNPSALDALLHGYEDAKRRAETLRARHVDNGSNPDSNPSSDVWELIDRLT